MNDDLDVRFDHRLRSAFRATNLPPAPARLGAVLDDLPRAVAPPRRPVLRWAATGALAASLAAAAIAGYGAFLRQAGSGPGAGATPSPSPSPSWSASPLPSPSPWPIFNSSPLPAVGIQQLLAGREDGSIGGGPVYLWGYYSDFRGWVGDPCATPLVAALELSCLDRRQGLVPEEESLGSVVDGRWVPTSGPVVHPYWPETTLSNPRVVDFLAMAPADPLASTPIFVLLVGHFDDALGAACPTDASPPCAERFVVDDIIQADDPDATPSAVPSGTPFPFASPPPPPSWMANCTSPRGEPGTSPEPGDPVGPGYSSAGWVPKSDIPFEFFAIDLLPETVYLAIIDGDFSVTGWKDDPEGSAVRFRWWGTAACIAHDDGIFYTWVPGTTYKLFEDGHRVDGGDPFDPPATSTAAP